MGLGSGSHYIWIHFATTMSIFIEVLVNKLILDCNLKYEEPNCISYIKMHLLSLLSFYDIYCNVLQSQYSMVMGKQTLESVTLEVINSHLFTIEISNIILSPSGFLFLCSNTDNNTNYLVELQWAVIIRHFK